MAGILAIIAALAPDLPALGGDAEEVAAFVATARPAAEALGITSLPTVTVAP